MYAIFYRTLDSIFQVVSSSKDMYPFYFVQAIFNEIDELFLQLYQDVTTNLLSSSNQIVKGTI